MLRKQYLFYVFFIFASHTKCGNIVSVTFFKISFLHTTQKSHKQCCTLEYVMLFQDSRIKEAIELPSVFFFQTQMLGVLHLSRSFWLWYLVHLSISVLVQVYDVETRVGALSYFSPARTIHFYFYFLHCISLKKGDHLVLSHSTNIIVTDSPVDLLCGH